VSAGQVTRILVVRHGETDWNAAGRIQGHTDIGLNERGRWQADRLAEALAGEGFDAVYASDMARTLQTLQPLATRLGLAPRSDSGLRERGFGRFEGLSFDQIERAWPDDAARWRTREPDFAPGGGESLTVFYARCVGAVERLGERHRGGSIAIVTHGGVLDCLYRAATRLELQAPRSWVLGNAALNRLLHTEQGFGLVGWNDDAHLNQVGVAD
jgi:probable phosphoglycerate mutase